MSRQNIDQWTLVEHSGLPRAVEEIAVTTQKQRDAVLAVGGVLFASYRDASAAEEAANYPPEVAGIYPRVRGRFAARRIGQQRIYVPPAPEATS